MRLFSCFKQKEEIMNKKKNTILLAISSLATLLSGCDQSLDSPDQSVICEAKQYNAVKDCKPGQKVAFTPDSWGNQQLPIYFTALNCDMRYSVALTEGGVVCIYNPLKSVVENSKKQ